jgi:hypothetical protein
LEIDVFTQDTELGVVGLSPGGIRDRLSPRWVKEFFFDLA